MGRHYKRKKSLILGIIKLTLIIVLSFALLFVFCRLHPEKFSPSIVSRAESISATSDRLRSKAFSLFKEDKDDLKVTSDNKLQKEEKEDKEEKERFSIVSKDITAKNENFYAEVTDKRPILAIVVDDGGNSLEMARQVASLELPLTWAILPYTRYAGETSSMADDAGIPYLLHLPMQAEIDKDPKEYLVGEGMDRNRIRDVTIKALDSLPSPIGINNHRGSLATSQRDIMVPVIDVLKERELLFLDSRTSGKSVAYETAKAAGIRSLKNQAFLDGTPDKDVIRARFDQVVKMTLQRGNMIAICHFRPATIPFLEKLNKEYMELPVLLVTLPEMAEILKEKEDDEEKQ
ncbi:MAG: divergent polysaccharide deacetylase family protein [Synergistaceae bacterium]|nr:divergent polysaccharide deacetylase family protein [Synergistaceae bacterium]